MDCNRAVPGSHSNSCCVFSAMSPQKAGSEEEEQQERARELEKRLEESSQHGETLRQEVDNLRHSLQQETELKSSAEGKIIEVCTWQRRQGKDIHPGQLSLFALGGIRTHDILCSRQMLYQLSYQGSSVGRVPGSSAPNPGIQSKATK